MHRRARVQIAAATLSENSLRQTFHTHRASVHQAAKLIEALIRVARVTAGLAESNGSLPPGLRLTSPAGWLPRTEISSGTLRSAIEHGLPFYEVSWTHASVNSKPADVRFGRFYTAVTSTSNTRDHAACDDTDGILDTVWLVGVQFIAPLDTI